VNKLLAKLACRCAKPDGVLVVAPGTAAMQDLISRTSIAQLPGTDSYWEEWGKSRALAM
jgi:nucleotidyltransferase/DNA polymerase involved in DNA repair